MHVHEIYEKHLKRAYFRAHFMAKYVSLPCIVLSAVLSLYFWYLGDMAMMTFQIMMIFLNMVSLNMQNMVKDRCQSMLDEIDVQDRKNKIREFNPNRR